MSKVNHYACDQCGTQECADHLPAEWVELGWVSSTEAVLGQFSVYGGPHFCGLPCLRMWLA